MCGHAPCAPMHPACTWSPEHRAACEVRAALAMPGLDARREYLRIAGQKRGQGAADVLRVSVMAEWERRK